MKHKSWHVHWSTDAHWSFYLQSLEQAIKTAQQGLLDEQNKLSSIQRDGEQSTEVC